MVSLHITIIPIVFIYHTHIHIFSHNGFKFIPLFSSIAKAVNVQIRYHCNIFILHIRKSIYDHDHAIGLHNPQKVLFLYILCGLMNNTSTANPLYYQSNINKVWSLSSFFIPKNTFCISIHKSWTQPTYLFT